MKRQKILSSIQKHENNFKIKIKFSIIQQFIFRKNREKEKLCLKKNHLIKYFRNKKLYNFSNKI